jgi:aerobic carbon-monoxide dehydrogenase small subunit
VRAVEQPVESLEIECTVNREVVRQTVPARLLLSDLLRDELGLTGTHVGCEHGVCGACTVLVDGAPARSCLVLAAQIDGADVITVEGLTPSDGLNTMQQAFKEHHGLQCGFCTPGFLTTLAGVDPAEYRDEQSIRDLLAGNLCRCTGYANIVTAVCDAWEVRA